jgi:hypothetical protein
MTIQTPAVHQNCAVYLPALQLEFAKFAHDGQFKRTLPFTPQDLNFLNPQSPLLYYPYALFSAGHAAKSLTAAPPQTIVSARTRGQSIVLGDSGGFQILTGAIKTIDAERVHHMMRWMEDNCDYSMVLDFPTAGIGRGQIAKHAPRLSAEGEEPQIRALAASNGLSFDFNLALHQTDLNNQQFVARHEPGATNFLNVLQGRNEVESKAWYEHVKTAPFSGWAFAGAHLKDFNLILQRLIDLRDDGLLGQAKWIHMLGKGEPDLACLFTVLQRTIRDQINPDLQISFDSASHSRLAGIFSIYTGATFDRLGWGMTAIPFHDHSLVGSTEKLGDFIASGNSKLPGAMNHVSTQKRAHRKFDPLYSAVSDILTVGDICIDGTKRTPWDSASLHMAAHHNVEIAVRTFRKAHELFFDDQHVNTVPTKARVVAAIIGEVFRSDKPDQLIAECSAILNDVTVNYPRPKSFASAP